MLRIALISCLLLLASFAGAQEAQDVSAAPPRIVSLDYCADQYVLALAPAAHITALSPDATSSFSYLKDQARGFRQIRPRAEDILTLQPDIVVRTYGGGPMMTAFLQRAGIKVVQIGYATDLNGIERLIEETASALHAQPKGAELIDQMAARLDALPTSLPEQDAGKEILYLTSKGATAGRETMIDDVINKAGFQNYQASHGWGSLPLESLAYKAPEFMATGFFETSDLTSDIWTSTRHPVAQRALQQAQIINLPGAWTSCSGWFLMDAVEAMATLAERKTP